jgi:hypothetical protein
LRFGRSRQRQGANAPIPVCTRNWQVFAGHEKTRPRQARFSLALTNIFNRVGQEYYGIVVPNSINDALGRRFAASLNLAL